MKGKWNSIAYLVSVVSYLIYLNSFWFVEESDRQSQIYMGGAAMIAFMFVNLIYTFLCLTSVVLAILNLVLKIPVLVLVSSGWLFLLTLVNVRVAIYFDVSTNFSYFAFLVVIYGVVCYFILSGVKKKQSQFSV